MIFGKNSLFVEQVYEKDNCVSRNANHNRLNRVCMVESVTIAVCFNDMAFELNEFVIRKKNPDSHLSFKGVPIELKKLNSGDELDLGKLQLVFRWA